MATGHARSVHFISAPRNLRKPEPLEQVEPEYEDMLQAPAPDPVGITIAALGDRVEQMAITLK